MHCHLVEIKRRGGPLARFGRSYQIEAISSQILLRQITSIPRLFLLIIELRFVAFFYLLDPGSDLPNSHATMKWNRTFSTGCVLCKLNNQPGLVLCSTSEQAFWSHFAPVIIIKLFSLRKYRFLLNWNNRNTRFSEK